ncbi:13546_t:CDS:1, partial [Racocetra persica]
RESLLELEERDRVIENSTIEENTIEVKPEEIIVYSDVLLESYLKFCDKEQKFHVFFWLKKGNVIVYDMLTSVYRAVLIRLNSLINRWSDQLIVSSDVDIIVGQNSVYRPDILVEPSQRGDPNPRMIVEIGIIESLDSLNNLAE